MWLLFLFFKCSKMFGHNFILSGGNIFLVNVHHLLENFDALLLLLFLE